MLLCDVTVPHNIFQRGRSQDKDRMVVKQTELLFGVKKFGLKTEKLLNAGRNLERQYVQCKLVLK